MTSAVTVQNTMGLTMYVYWWLRASRLKIRPEGFGHQIADMTIDLVSQKVLLVFGARC